MIVIQLVPSGLAPAELGGPTTATTSGFVIPTFKPSKEGKLQPWLVHTQLAGTVKMPPVMYAIMIRRITKLLLIVWLSSIKRFVSLEHPSSIVEDFTGVVSARHWGFGWALAS